MRHIPAIAGRELRSIFATPVAYVIFTVYAVFAGFIFFASLGLFLTQLQQIQALGMLQLLEQWNLNDVVIAPAFFTFAIVFLVLIPLLTMRAFAEERATGSIELLLTSPVSVWEIVIGKYLAVLAIVALLVALTALYPGLLFLYGNPEVLQTLTGLLALFLYGAALAALGCFVSALTRNQIIAGSVGIVAALVLLVLPAAAEGAQNEGVRSLLQYLGTSSHYEHGLRGELRSEDLAYFGAMILIFLSLGRAAIDSLRWR
ncbi:MAG: ABC transporter permease subunit [Myxococcota bacterium]